MAGLVRLGRCAPKEAVILSIMGTMLLLDYPASLYCIIPMHKNPAVSLTPFGGSFEVMLLSWAAPQL